MPANRAPNCAHCAELYPGNPGRGIHKSRTGTEGLICGECAADEDEWLRDEDPRNRPDFESDADFDYADTMSGGCIQL